MRLIVTNKIWVSWFYIGPFGKPAAPPFVILGKRMKLRQVKCYHLGCDMLGWAKVFSFQRRRRGMDLRRQLTALHIRLGGPMAEGRSWSAKPMSNPQIVPSRINSSFGNVRVFAEIPILVKLTAGTESSHV